MEKLYNFINKYHTTIPENELEIRFGSFDRFFSSNVSFENFNKMLNLLKNPIVQEIDDTIFHKFNIRQRKFRNTGRIQWIEKKKIDNIDLHSLNIRASVASENVLTFNQVIKQNKIKNPTKFFSMDKITLFRRKKRYSQNIGSWRIDLTRVQNLIYKNNNWSEKSIEYELELELINTKDAIKSLKDNHDIFFAILEKNKLSGYFDLINSNKFIGNQPKTLERKNISQLVNEPYSLTEKADGERMFLYLGDENILINKKLNTIPFNSKNEFKETIIDGEYLNDTFYAFDILYFKGVNIMNKNLEERHVYLDKLKNISKNFKIKTFYYSQKPKDTISFVKIPKNNIFKKSLMIWNNKQKLFKYQLDGLIYTPINQEYNNTTDIFKWKDVITIDVVVKNKQFFARNKNKLYNLSIDDDTLTIDNPIIIDNSIVELYYDNGWKYLKTRDDKKFPNAVLTVKSALKAIKENISIEDISNININDSGNKYVFHGKDKSIRNTEIDINYRKFHNFVKNHILTINDTNEFPKYLLDLGTGKGGDMIKWKKNNFSHILAIDSSWEHIYGNNGFKDRFNKIKNSIMKNIDITYAWGDVSKGIKTGASGLSKDDKNNIKQFFNINGNVKFNKITCNFAIHYLMDNEKMFNKFIKNIKQLLDKNGLFVGTFLDGNKLKQNKIFKNNNQEIYRYNKLFDKTPQNINEYWTIKPRISVKTYQWDSEIEEPVIYPQIFEQMLKEYKLNIKFIDFKDLYDDKFNLNDDEKELSFMHKVFIISRK